MSANGVSREIPFPLQGMVAAGGKFPRSFVTQYSDAEEAKSVQEFGVYLECEFTILTAFDLCVRASSSAKRNS